MEKPKVKDGHGGWRAGAGRKKPTISKTPICLTLPINQVALLRASSDSPSATIEKLLREHFGE